MSRVQMSPGELDLSLVRLRQVRQGSVEAMKLSLAAKGQLAPLVAARVEDRSVLVDGFCRQRAALELAWPLLDVELLDLSAAQMKAQVYLRNRERGLTLTEQCRLVHELTELEGLSQVEIAALLERHKSWVCRRLMLARTLSPRLLEDTALGLLTPGSLRTVAQLPIRNQEELVAVALRDDLGARELSELAALWRKAPTTEAREYLLSYPRAALARAQKTEPQGLDARLGDGGQELLRGLQILAQTGGRLFRTVTTNAGADWTREARELLGKAFQVARHEAENALAAVERALSKAPGGDDARRQEG